MGGAYDLTGRWHEILERVERAARRGGREPRAVTVIAVSKGVPVERVQAARAAGCRVFGESRVQEALGKMEALAPAPLDWHLLGPLQTNKIPAVAGRFTLIHAVDRLVVAERLDTVARARGVVQPVLLEVNIAGEPSKHGFRPEELPAVIERLAGCKGLRILGLMTIPPLAASSEQTRPYFRRLRRLAEEIETRRIPEVSMKELSMGMSADFEGAIAEGATMVRIGTALFGPRAQQVAR